MTSKQTHFTFIDLFARIGGFRIALEASGGKCVFSSEINRQCRHVYYKNFGELPFGDIKKIDVTSIPKHDILYAGFDPSDPKISPYGGDPKAQRERSRSANRSKLTKFFGSRRAATPAESRDLAS